MSGELDRFIDELCALELDPEQLRRDPTGAAWLPAALRAQVEADPACARELAEHVAMELALYELPEPRDALFTRRVMEQLPELEAVDERRRTWILASAYALAIGVAYLLLGPLLGSGAVAGWLESFDALPEWGQAHRFEAAGLWLGVVLLLVAGVLTLAPTERREADA